MGCAISRIFKNFVARRAQKNKVHELTQKNIYIFPSKQGGVFLLMLLLMLVTAINYQSSLIYLFVFILFSVFVLSIWLCFFNLHGVRFRVDSCPAIEAGNSLRVKFSLLDSGKDRWGVRAVLDNEKVVESAGLESKGRPESPAFVWFANARDGASSGSVIVLEGQSYSRGVYALPGVKFETFFPFGLVRAWTWLWFDSSLIVYPIPIAPPVGQDAHASDQSQEKKYKGTEPDDSRRFQSGDALRRVMWRHYALRDELMVQDSAWQGSSNTALQWETYAGFGVEQALSFLCFDVMHLARENLEFSLTMPNGEVAMGVGAQHLDSCLALLAGFK